jgi:hypothetical protein
MSYRAGSVIDVTEPGDVPAELLARLRPICLGLPEAYEEPAWVGIRWRVRTRTFAHVLTIDPDRQAVYARAVRTDEPVCVLTFRSPGSEIAALLATGYPFFKAGWGEDVVVMMLAPESGRSEVDWSEVDWSEVAELITDSYCVLAPKKLAARVVAPPG